MWDFSNNEMVAANSSICIGLSEQKRPYLCSSRAVWEEQGFDNPMIEGMPAGIWNTNIIIDSDSLLSNSSYAPTKCLHGAHREQPANSLLFLSKVRNRKAVLGPGSHCAQQNP